MIKNRLQWLNTVVTEPYYLFHFLIFFSYLPFRLSATAASVSSFSPEHLFRREIQAVLAYSILAAVKAVREENWEGFIADILFFGKHGDSSPFLDIGTSDFSFSAFLKCGLPFDFMVYAGIFSALYNSRTASISRTRCSEYSDCLTPLQLETTLIEGNTSRYWLIEFRALCSSSCVRNSRIFPELSVTYSNKNLSFGVVDLGLFPNVAEKYGISLTGNEGLPTYILFENNAEVIRFPGVDLVAKASNHLISKKYLSRHFGLDLLLLEYVNGK